MTRVNCDRLVLCEGKLITVRMASIKTGLAPSTIMKMHHEGRPIVKQPQRGKAPRRVMHNGQLMTAEEIAKLEGLAPETVRARIRAGQPLGRIKREYKGTLIEHEGRKWMVSELAKELGMTTGKLYYRIKCGLPLTGPLPPRERKPKTLTESGEHPISRGEGENGLYWEDDLEARVWHLYCGGDGFGECTLGEIAALWDLSRERIRQVQDAAIRKVRGLAARGNSDALDALKWFEERMEQANSQQPNHWEQAELNSPGSFELASWNKATNTTEVERRLGNTAYADQPHIIAAKRGGEATRGKAGAA